MENILRIANFVCIVSGSFYVNRHVFPFIYEMNYNNPICFNVPPAITGYALTTHLIKQIIPMPVFARDAVFNEILYRYGLQEVIFKRIPERLLQKTRPLFRSPCKFINRKNH